MQDNDIQKAIHDFTKTATLVVKNLGDKDIAYVVYDSPREFHSMTDRIIFLKSIRNIIRDDLMPALKVTTMHVDSISRLNNFLSVIDPLNETFFCGKSYVEAVAEILQGYEKVSDIMKKEDLTSFFHQRMLVGIYLYPLLRKNFYEKASTINVEKMDDALMTELLDLNLEEEDSNHFAYFQSKTKIFRDWWSENNNVQPSKLWKFVGKACCL